MLAHGTFVLLGFLTFLGIPLLVSAQSSEPVTSLSGTVWDGSIYDQAAGKGAIHLSFYSADYGNGKTPIEGSFFARFVHGRANNSGVIEHLVRTDHGIAFQLVSMVSSACAYDVTAARRGNRLTGSYVGANGCTQNTGTFDASLAQ